MFYNIIYKVTKELMWKDRMYLQWNMSPSSHCWGNHLDTLSYIQVLNLIWRLDICRFNLQVSDWYPNELQIIPEIISVNQPLTCGARIIPGKLNKYHYHRCLGSLCRQVINEPSCSDIENTLFSSGWVWTAWPVSTMKHKCPHFDEIFITGCTGCCHFDKFQCYQ